MCLDINPVINDQDGSQIFEDSSGALLSHGFFYNSNFKFPTGNADYS